MLHCAKLSNGKIAYALGIFSKLGMPNFNLASPHYRGIYTLYNWQKNDACLYSLNQLKNELTYLNFEDLRKVYKAKDSFFGYKL